MGRKIITRRHFIFNEMNLEINDRTTQITSENVTWELKQMKNHVFLSLIFFFQLTRPHKVEKKNSLKMMEILSRFFVCVWVLGGVKLWKKFKKNKLQYRWMQIFEAFEPATFRILRQKLGIWKIKTGDREAIKNTLKIKTVFSSAGLAN